MNFKLNINTAIDYWGSASPLKNAVGILQCGINMCCMRSNESENHIILKETPELFHQL